MDVDVGRTYIRFGTPKHLGADDLIELTRNNRRRTAARSRIEHSDTTGSAYERLEFKSKGNPERKIVVDAGDILRNLVIQLREENV